MCRFILLGLIVIGLYSCESNQEPKLPQQPTTLFSLLHSSQTGIDFVNKLEDNPLKKSKNIMSWTNYYNGGGVAIGDINNDGLQDIFFSGNEVPNRLYLNKGNMKFEDISEKAGINKNKRWAMGVSMADVNGDGWLDIYVAQDNPFNAPASERQNLLYINNGDLTFSESAREYGLNDDNLGRQAIFFDFDKDGDLDCFVLNNSKYVRVPLGRVFKDIENKKNLEDASCNLYRNDNGKFVNITEQAGMLKYGFGLGVGVSDINQDGWLDVYVANDYSVPDFMYINNGDGTFTDKIKEKTKQISFYGMGCDIADINNDGLVDIGVVDMSTSDHIRGKTLMASMSNKNFWTLVNDLGYQYQFMYNSLQLNNGNGTFSNIANLSGLSSSEWSWASLFADFDNDGDKDYFIANGYRRYARDNDSRLRMNKVRKEYNGKIPLELRKQLYSEIPVLKLPNRFYQNNSDLTFTDKAKQVGLNQPSFSNGAAYGDLDNDGDLDLVVNNIDMEAFVYQNNSKNHYLSVKLEGENSKSPIIGTKVSIYYKDGQQQFVEYSNIRGYYSSVENNVVHFGLGDVTKIDRLEVIWPNDKMQILENIKANQILTLKEKDAVQTKNYAKQQHSTIVKPVDSKRIKVDFVHKENIFDDFEKEILLPHKQSTLGPKLAVGDVNGDGLDDFFVGGALNQSGALYIQRKNGTFSKSNTDFGSKYEDLNALFFDFDGDKDLDLYVASGGGGDMPMGSPKLQDRLYKNDGQGHFSEMVGVIPKLYSSSSVVKAGDFDGDGDLDLFVGGRAIPGKYPYPDKSAILRNDGGKFTNVTQQWLEKEKLGIVTDAIFTDFNRDSKLDLIVVGEWMNITFLQNTNGKFEDVSSTKLEKPLRGWWYSIQETDVDGDGDLDLICGNLGTNSKFHASDKKPFQVFSNDFDGNGTNDIVLVKKYKGKNVPSRGRECSSQQMPSILDKFPTYSSFAHADVESILGKKVDSALKLSVNYFNSAVLINENGKYIAKPLPNLAQVSPINGIVTHDVNGDHKLDLIIAGNNFDTEVETPRYDAGIGRILIGNGDGTFNPMGVNESGFFASLNAKDLKMIKKSDGYYLVVANNNDVLQFFEMK